MTLATTLLNIEQSATAVEDVARGILSTIRDEDVATLDHWNEIVSDAYAANGWNRVNGAPPAGTTPLPPAPDSVKVYVSTVRAGYRLALPMTTFETMGALRSAVREARRVAAAATAQQPPELKGVKVSRVSSLNGALWHDAVVIWEHLPADQQTAFEEQVRKLLTRFTRKADLAAAA